MFITYDGRNVSRVRVLATIVRKFINEDKSYGFLVLDDGTETIRIKAWREDVTLIEKYNEGDIIDVFGKVREFGEEIYIVPEIIVRIDDPNWEILRELEIMYDKLERSKSELTEISETTVLDVVERLDKGEGVHIRELMRELGNPPRENLQKVLRILMSRGEIYENKPNHYRKVGV
ncbi:MAG: OB-fold nucleic acid binding domain-containing protein [Candidatus Baldrarchaeia archaeon]